MKNASIIIAALIFSCMLISCDNEKEDQEPEINVIIKAVPESYDSVPSSVRVAITNNTDQEIGFGNDYSVEYQNGKEWEKLSFIDEENMNDLWNEIPAGETEEFSFSLNPVIGNYEKGQYRIRRGIYQDGKWFILYAVFRIN